jgi:hypothetical protein
MAEPVLLESPMLVFYAIASIYGAILTAASLWAHGSLLALAAAPFGGSAVVMLAALIFGLLPHYGFHTRKSAAVGRASPPG